MHAYPQHTETGFRASQSHAVQFWQTANQRAAVTRLKLFSNLQPKQLDRELPNLRASANWLMKQRDKKSATLFLNYLETLAPYLRLRGLDYELEHWCEAGLQACERLQLDSTHILLIHGEAQYALGQWERANTSWQSAINVSKEIDQFTYARATSALGRLQINQGKYKLALNTLERAENLLQEMGETEEIISIRSEIAAYYLNRRELDKALKLYLDIDRLHKKNGAAQSSDHTLLMLGVTYRQKGVFDKAIDYLLRLYRRGEAQRNLASMATAAHHLAWTFIEQGKLKDANYLCGQALALYQEIKDPRGLSDGYEQLGAILLENRDIKNAITYLNLSAQMRQRLGNRPGFVSSLRRLALAHLLERNHKKVIHLLFKILVIYIQLGIFSRQRAFALLHDFAAGLKKSLKSNKQTIAQVENGYDHQTTNETIMETFSRSLINTWTPRTRH